MGLSVYRSGRLNAVRAIRLFGIAASGSRACPFGPRLCQYSNPTPSIHKIRLPRRRRKNARDTYESGSVEFHASELRCAVRGEEHVHDAFGRAKLETIRMNSADPDATECHAIRTASLVRPGVSASGDRGGAL